MWQINDIDICHKSFVHKKKKTCNINDFLMGRNNAMWISLNINVYLFLL